MWSPSGKSEMVRGAVVVGPSTLSVRNLIYVIDLAWGKPTGLRNDLFFMVFWVLHMCEVFWFQSLFSVETHGFTVDLSAFVAQ